MPELPEVETIVNYLSRKVLNRTFLDIWCDFLKTIRIRSLDSSVNKYGFKTKDQKLGGIKRFKEAIRGKKIKRIWRRGKNIIFELSGDISILIHQKMTGHFLLGKWRMENGKWKPDESGLLEEPVNRFIHLMFWLDNGEMLALSDLRKFAKVELWSSKELQKSEDFKNLGPEPLGNNFSFKKFRRILKNKETADGNMRSRSGKIKQVLMDQSVIAGIGNIYSDEILWEAKIHPFKNVADLQEKELKAIYSAIKKTLKQAIKLRGDSMSDYRLPSGEKGKYQEFQKVYQQEGNFCKRCEVKIKRVKIGGRSAHFCPTCQKLD